MALRLPSWPVRRRPSPVRSARVRRRNRRGAVGGQAAAGGDRDPDVVPVAGAAICGRRGGRALRRGRHDRRRTRRVRPAAAGRVRGRLAIEAHRSPRRTGCIARRPCRVAAGVRGVGTIGLAGEAETKTPLNGADDRFGRSALAAVTVIERSPIGGLPGGYL